MPAYYANPTNIGAITDAKEFRQMGEMTWAARQVSSVQILTCKFVKGCSSVPSCRDIWGLQSRKFPPDSLEAVETTRKAHFTIGTVVALKSFTRTHAISSVTLVQIQMLISSQNVTWEVQTEKVNDYQYFPKCVLVFTTPDYNYIKRDCFDLHRMYSNCRDALVAVSRIVL
ncbi:hypothetical protein BP5796_04910 [Coleophoma crateriformis]|uniref:Uncharacterized protein n=1 Tax=Coleophoma crateriformis TaxID=565419 RepID=A0A3D8SAM0_9HELO|nr:hypothetical protein BP5796_04910 [Coleophoma crateriformis]